MEFRSVSRSPTGRLPPPLQPVSFLLSAPVQDIRAITGRSVLMSKCPLLFNRQHGQRASWTCLPSPIQHPHPFFRHTDPLPPTHENPPLRRHRHGRPGRPHRMPEGKGCNPHRCRWPHSPAPAGPASAHPAGTRHGAGRPVIAVGLRRLLLLPGRQLQRQDRRPSTPPSCTTCPCR